MHLEAFASELFIYIYKVHSTDLYYVTQTFILDVINRCPALFLCVWKEMKES